MFGGAFGIQWGIGLLADLFGTWQFTPQAALTMAFACLVILQLCSLAWFLLRSNTGVTPDAATSQQSPT
jgi:type VI protein secretion system component VasK